MKHFLLILNLLFLLQLKSFSQCTANAGPDRTECGGVTSVFIHGSVSIGATGGLWTTSGTGQFLPNANSLNPYYIPSSQDTSSGSVILTLTTLGCGPASDNMTLSFYPHMPFVNAGPDKAICETSTVNIQATSYNASQILWNSSGTGVFTNPISPSTNYLPSNNDLSNGSIKLWIEGDGNGGCVSLDTIIIVLTPNKVNAGPDQTNCTYPNGTVLNGTLSGPSNGYWSTNGSGTFSPNNSSLNATYIHSYADEVNGSVLFTLTSLTNGTCPSISDQMKLVFANPTASTGHDPNIANCVGSSIQLNGVVTNAPGGRWRSTGGGIFLPDTNSLNATYFLSAADLVADSFFIELKTTENGLCNAAYAGFVLIAEPKVDAGIDQSVCINTTAIPLNGVVTRATGGIWTTSGTGTFTPNATSLNASYIVSSADKLSGKIKLTLTSTGNGKCSSTTDTLLINLVDPTVNAGADQTICSGTSANISGTVTIATGGTWTTSGSGTFSNPNALSTNYIPSMADQTNGSVTLTLTSTGNGICNAVSDQVTINMMPGQGANAGPDQTICSNTSEVLLSGTISGATGSTWTSSGTGTFLPNENTLNATYVPSLEDDSSQTINLTLIPSGNASCSGSDVMVIRVAHPTAYLQNNVMTSCSNLPEVDLDGSVTDATGGTWTSTGSGTFSNANDLVTKYIPSPTDLSYGSIKLILTTTGNGACPAGSDHILLFFIAAPIANAGPDQPTCPNASFIDLKGSIANTVGGNAFWSTSGSGTFNYDTLITAQYTPSAADKAAGTVTLTLSVEAYAGCNDVSDQMIISFSEPPATANAGADQTTCDNVPADISASISTASGGKWTSSGGGIFSDANALSSTYLPSTTDRVAGNAILTFTTIGSIGCIATDNLTLTLTKSPTVDAGLNQLLSIDGVTLSGSVTVATGGIWTTTGSGFFIPDNTTLSSIYYPSADDITRGSVKLTLTSTGNGSCLPVSDYVVLTGNAQACNITITAIANNNSLSFQAENNDDTSLGSYLWDFGDGTSAIGKAQNHIYQTAGSYNASVYFTTQDLLCSATEYHLVTITSVSIQTYSLSGNIRAGYYSLDNGAVSLFKLINSYYSLLQTQEINAGDNGSFYFSNLDNGTYILQASVDPSSFFANSYSPTYFGNTADWSTATQIVINNKNLSSNVIDLINYVSSDVTWNTGRDILSGTITFDSSQPLRLASSSVNPVAHAIVYLYNNNNVLLTSTSTNNFGYYEFTNLLAGTYTIKVEYAGGTSNNTSTVIDGNPTTHEIANSEVIKQNISTGLSNTPLIFVEDAKMYPNPTSTICNIELPSEVKGATTISIYNAMGQLQYQEEHNIISGNNISMNVQSLSSGLYIVEVINGSKIYKGKLSKN